MDPDALANSTRGGAVKFSEHKRWFTERLRDPDTLMFVGHSQMHGFEPVGWVRYGRIKSGKPIWTGGPIAREDGPAEVSVIIAPEVRGRGYATDLLREALPPADWTHRLRALILLHNTASARAFAGAGYSLVGQETRMGKDHLVYEREL